MFCGTGLFGKYAYIVECAGMIKRFMEVHSGALQMEIEELEEPIALPVEEIKDAPVPGEENEDMTNEESEEVMDEEDAADAFLTKARKNGIL